MVAASLKYYLVVDGAYPPIIIADGILHVCGNIRLINEWK